MPQAAPRLPQAPEDPEAPRRAKLSRGEEGVESAQGAGQPAMRSCQGPGSPYLWLPLTMIFAGSCYEFLDKDQREPTTIMVLAAEGSIV